MKLEDIDFHNLKRYPYLFWGSEETIRYHYSDNKRFYKIWSKKFFNHLIANVGDRYEPYTVLPHSGLSSFSCGLIDSNIASAFVDFIYDRTNFCRGYITLSGLPLEDNEEIPQDFVDKLIHNTFKSGFAYPDLKPSNVIRIRDKLSLIDLDSPPVCLKSLDLDFQKKEGFLREGHSKYYSQAILEHISQKDLEDF